MTYDEFVQAVEEKIKEELSGRVCVSVYTAQKYNGALRKGLLFCEYENNVSPTIYLEEYYRQYRCGKPVELAVREIAELYREIRFREPWEDEFIRNYDNIKEKLVYRLIHREKNKEILKEMPYIPYLDLAIVFYVLLEAGPYGTAAMPVKTEHLRIWHVTEQQIYERACENTECLLPYEFRTIRSVIAELTDMDDTGEDDVLYVLSNHLRSFGASALLYQGRLEEVGEYLGEDYYVLPSSVHEVIVIRKSAASGKEFLSAIVKEINETQVEREEVLSNQAYYYDRTCKRLTM